MGGWTSGQEEAVLSRILTLAQTCLHMPALPNTVLGLQHRDSIQDSGTICPPPAPLSETTCHSAQDPMVEIAEAKVELSKEEEIFPVAPYAWIRIVGSKKGGGRRVMEDEMWC